MRDARYGKGGRFAWLAALSILMAAACSTQEPPVPTPVPTSVKETAAAQPVNLSQKHRQQNLLQPHRPVPAADLPSIILVTIDALRPDHMHTFGYDRKTTNFIDKLAKESVVFQHAISSSSWTAPAMASLFTSRYARTHSVRHGVYLPRETLLIMQERLPGALNTLAERLMGMGYDTIGISSNPHLVRDVQFHQGFRHFWEDHGLRDALRNGIALTEENLYEVVIDAKKVTEKALEYMEKRDQDRPYFLWVHYMDPHSPYFARDPYYTQFTGKPADEFPLSTSLNLADQTTLLVQLQDESKLPTDEVIEELKAAYDSEIAYTDKYLDDLIARLPNAKDALLVVTSDHGEQFYEHGYLSHGFTLHGEEVRIPLLIRLPEERRKTGVIDDLVSIVDIAPTIIDFINGPADDDDQGISLIRYFSEDQPEPLNRTLYSELERFDRYQLMARSENRKLILRNGINEALLYDLKSDPEEKTNLIEERPEHVKRLLADIEEWRKKTPASMGVRPQIDLGALKDGAQAKDPRVEELRALGYVQ